MADIAISWDSANSRGDWTMNGPVLATGNDIETAILISIFTDRMAQSGDVIPDGTNDPRGWWADDDVPIGSRMWLLKRAKQTTQTLQLAYDYLAEALQWMVDDGVVGKFDITTQWVRRGMLGATIVAYSPTGTILSKGQYSWAWSGIN
ncbi:phage gp46-like protein [Paraburkholderia bannensis]|uniref:Phage gp46-like protein n=1 Tax=Paraburkholderia bannensis TaxID=765414 RepID=A0A7W9TUU6_9BURK|nr:MULTISPECIES: phage GP46 family protein [Paraburkholderia]MBB3256855.1 phage gp46-like protein [Paraburkholderia sp. WP4_3_2]MBB6101852.1 phage gp46-like protein [Paraburkholderia bannensis]